MNKPAAKRDEITAIIHENLNDIDAALYDVALVGIRGYFLDTMGKPGKNDRAIYDDAIFIVSPNVFAAFNANCDPGAFKSHIATLTTGVWKYKIGIHGLSKPAMLQYQALVQAGEVTVARDGVAKPDTGMFGINIHRGGRHSVSSLGCQTINPVNGQWDAFIATVKAELKRAGQRVVPYILIDETARRDGRLKV